MATLCDRLFFFPSFQSQSISFVKRYCCTTQISISVKHPIIAISFCMSAHDGHAKSHVHVCTCGRKTWMKLRFLKITCLCLRKISFPTPAKASSGQMLIQKGFSCSVPTLPSFRVLEPGHGLPVTCPGKAIHRDLSSISRRGWFIPDNTSSQACRD